jgi:hypothetical protein
VNSLRLFPLSTYRGRVETGRVYPSSQMERTLQFCIRDGIMEDIVKGGGRATPPPPSSPAWANLSIMMECTLEGGWPLPLCVYSVVDPQFEILEILK